MQYNTDIYSMYMFILSLGEQNKKIANGLKGMYSVYMFSVGRLYKIK